MQVNGPGVVDEGNGLKVHLASQLEISSSPQGPDYEKTRFGGTGSVCHLNFRPVRAGNRCSNGLAAGNNR
jgi:hypothetical protein